MGRSHVQRLIGFSADYVWVTGTTNDVAALGYLCKVDPSTNTVVSCYRVGLNPRGLDTNRYLGQVYVANNKDNTVSVFDFASNAVTSTVNVGAGPIQVAVDPNTYNVFVTNNLANTVSVLQPQGVTPFSWSVTNINVGFKPWGVAIDPSTDNVWVTNSGDGTVSVLSGFTYNTLATIKVGDTPKGIALATASHTAYVADSSTGAVTTINMATFSPSTTTIGVGNGPLSVAGMFVSAKFPPNLIFVTNNLSNTLSVIDASTNTVVATIVVP